MSDTSSAGFARQAIFELEGTVSQNRAKAFIARSQVAENSVLANQNYNAAFLVNRRIANENTDALFRYVPALPPPSPPHLISSHPFPINTAFGSVRTGILQRVPAPDQLTQDFKEAMLNKARIEFLIFRSKVNEQATALSNPYLAPI